MASGTSVRAIARVVRVSEAALYRHFPSKQAIFDEVLQRADGGLLASQLSGMDAALADRDPPTFLRATAEVLLRGWDQPPARQIASVVARALGETHADIITAAWRVEANWADCSPTGSIRGTSIRQRAHQISWRGAVRAERIRAAAVPARRSERGYPSRQSRPGHRHLEFFIVTVFNGTHDKEIR